jgi:hypothetical protein
MPTGGRMLDDLVPFADSTTHCNRRMSRSSRTRVLISIDAAMAICVDVFTSVQGSRKRA